MLALSPSMKTWSWGVSDKNQQEDGRGHFFAVDRRAWACACGIGMVPAVAYLVLARGTGGDQRTTAWSINAIEKYTNIGRPRAQKGIKALEKARLIRIVQKGSRPRYYIVPAHEVEGAPQPLSDDERQILNLITGGNNAIPKIGRYDNAWKFGRPYETACALERKGYVRDLGGQRFEIIPGGPARVSEDPDWIWLPNSLVDGASGEVPPIERVRQTQNIAALRIFIDLYHAHNLANEGGVNWRSPDGFRQKFERLSIGETHQYAVWGFKPGTAEMWLANPVFAPHYDAAQKNGKTFWNAWSLLKTLGLVEMVAHLVEDDTDGEPMHPLADGNGEEGERAIWDAAFRAASAMATENQIRWAIDQKVRIIVPVLKHIGNVQVVGIARLRHRPRTRATAIWYASGSEWTRWARHYEGLAAVAEGREAAAAEGREVRYATSR